jgi:uncharacterized protein (DUF3084 family)
MPDTEISWFENGQVGFHLTLNPQKPLPIEARINRQFLDHQLRLGDGELAALMAGRQQGIEAIKTLIYSSNAPVQSKAHDIATQLADVLLDKSLSAQLSREAPNMQDTLQKQDEMFREMFKQQPPYGDKRASPPSLLESVPVGIGASLTIHF